MSSTWGVDFDDGFPVLEVDDRLVFILLRGATAEEGLLFLHWLAHAYLQRIYLNAVGCMSIEDKTTQIHEKH
jgi:hypothetical protein